MEKTFIDKIDNMIKEKHLLHHSFYRSWNEGTLSHETIKNYAAQYFHHVSCCYVSRAG